MSKGASQILIWARVKKWYSQGQVGTCDEINSQGIVESTSSMGASQIVAWPSQILMWARVK